MSLANLSGGMYARHFTDMARARMAARAALAAGGLGAAGAGAWWLRDKYNDHVAQGSGDLLQDAYRSTTDFLPNRASAFDATGYQADLADFSVDLAKGPSIFESWLRAG